MPEEAPEAPVEEQETPESPEAEAPEAPDTPEQEETPSEPEIDYRKRYEDLRPEFDRANQVLAALQGRHGPEAQAQAAQMFGFELEDVEEIENEDLDPREEIEKIRRELRERDEQAEAKELELAEQEWIQQEIGKVAKSEGRDLTQEEKDIITSYAISHRFEDGQPDIEGGHERLRAIYKAAKDRLISSKRNAPTPPQGAPGDETIDTSTPEGRRAAIEQIAEAANAVPD